MAANTAPIFSLAPRVSFTAGITAANTATDGTGTVSTVITAGTNGSFIQKIIARSLGTNAATVLRIFVNNGSTNATATNNAMVHELSLAATTASNSIQIFDVVLPINYALPAGFKLNATLGTAAAAGWIVTAIGGDY